MGGVLRSTISPVAKPVMAVGNVPVMPHNLVLLEGGMIAYTADVDTVAPGYDLFVVDGVK